MHFQWYPGHMTKARRMMQENIKLIDLVIELVDARAPMSSRNPDIDELGKGKARLILLNKADLAEDRLNDEWLDYFKGKGFSAVKVNSKKGGGIKSIQGVIQEACKEKTERDRKRGILNRPVRAMVVGIPNVGKSTFINALAGKACAKTGNKPGVTKGKQWIRLNKSVELLDTPGSIKDEILQTEELAAELAKFMNSAYPGVLEEKYGIPAFEDPYEGLKSIAESRHCLVRGSELDTEKAARRRRSCWMNSGTGSWAGLRWRLRKSRDFPGQAYGLERRQNGNERDNKRTAGMAGVYLYCDRGVLVCRYIYRTADTGERIIDGDNALTRGSADRG